jgi:N-glycosylase/DNA lyase
MSSILFSVDRYDLAATLNSGQAFRWECVGNAWESVVGNQWVRVHQIGKEIHAETVVSIENWNWLEHYLQVNLEFDKVVATFPNDEPMRLAREFCSGLRLLRQEPWECLASFILSSTKQIVQIRQIVKILCERFGAQVPCPEGASRAFRFPTANELSGCTEAVLRECKMGFRAPYLLAAAKMVSSNEVRLDKLHELTANEAREELLRLPGVGKKIADCVLLFAYGFQEAFPVDVWVMKALRELYFRKKRPSLKRLHLFSSTYFGPNAGYAQQYLFHYMRLNKTLPVSK